MPPRQGGQPSTVAKHDADQRCVLPLWHPPNVTASPHGLLCPQHPRGGQGCASLCLLHPSPTLVHADAPISQPHFWTFLAGQKGYFYWGLRGDDSQFPIFASTCPGEVSWQVSSSWAGGAERGQGSHEMLQPPFWAETPQCVAKTQGCYWGVSESRCLGKRLHCRELLPPAGCTGQTPNPFSPGASPAALPCLPRRFLQGPVTRLKDAGTDWGEQPQAVSVQGRGHCQALAPGDQPQAPPWPNYLVCIVRHGLGGVFKGKAQPVSKQDSKTSLHSERGVMGRPGGFTPC